VVDSPDLCGEGAGQPAHRPQLTQRGGALLQINPGDDKSISFQLKKCFNNFAKISALEPLKTDLHAIRFQIRFCAQIKQKQAVRIISNAGFRNQTAPLFAQLCIPPIGSTYKIVNLQIYAQLLSQPVPRSFREIWNTNRERNPNKELRNANDLYIPLLCNTKKNASV
jgi:hypothetical protein